MRTRRILAGTLCLGALVVAAVSAAAFANDNSGSANGLDMNGVGVIRATTGPINGNAHQVRVVVRDKQGADVAIVTITKLAQGGNIITVNARNLAPGFHAWHIHSVGACDPSGEKPFASAGGHFNLTNAPEGMQAGVFPVLLVGPNRAAWARFVDDSFNLDDLFGPSGTAIVIHAGADNYANIPVRYKVDGVPGPDAETMATGDAGARIACGVVSPMRTAGNAPGRPECHPSPSVALPDRTTEVLPRPTDR